MADRIVVMNGGVVEQAGTPLDIYDSPSNRYVAGFIGSPSMNFMTARVTDGPEPRLEIGPDFSLPTPTLVNLRAGQVVSCGIRPEHLVPQNEGVPAKIQLVEPTGSETQLVVRAGGTDLTCLVRERLDVRPGEEIHLSVEPSNIHVFDLESGVTRRNAAA